MLRTVAAIACDIVEALAIECTVHFNAKTAREPLCQLVLPIMGIANTVGKVGGRMSVLGEAAREAVLTYRRCGGHRLRAYLGFSGYL